MQYRDPEMIQKVKDAAGNKIHHALDTVSGNDTQFTAIKALAEDKAGKLTLLLPHAEGIQDVRKDVQVASSYTPLLSDHLFGSATNEPSRSTVVNIFTSYGVDYGPKTADENARRVLSGFLQKVPGLVRDGKLKHIPVKKFDGGLEKVVSDGFDYIAKGQVSAEKIVFVV